MGSILGLGIDSRIPIIVIKDYGVRSCQVNTKTTCTSWKQEGEYIWIFLKIFHHEAPIL